MDDSVPNLKTGDIEFEPWVQTLEIDLEKGTITDHRGKQIGTAEILHDESTEGETVILLRKLPCTTK